MNCKHFAFNSNAKKKLKRYRLMFLYKYDNLYFTIPNLMFVINRAPPEKSNFFFFICWLLLYLQTFIDSSRPFYICFAKDADLPRISDPQTNCSLGIGFSKSRFLQTDLQHLKGVTRFHPHISFGDIRFNFK